MKEFKQEDIKFHYDVIDDQRTVKLLKEIEEDLKRDSFQPP